MVGVLLLIYLDRGCWIVAYSPNRLLGFAFDAISF